MESGHEDDQIRGENIMAQREIAERIGHLAFWVGFAVAASAVTILNGAVAGDTSGATTSPPPGHGDFVAVVASYVSLLLGLAVMCLGALRRETLPLVPMILLVAVVPAWFVTSNLLVAFLYWQAHVHSSNTVVVCSAAGGGKDACNVAALASSDRQSGFTCTPDFFLAYSPPSEPSSPTSSPTILTLSPPPPDEWVQIASAPFPFKQCVEFDFLCIRNIFAENSTPHNQTCGLREPN